MGMVLFMCNLACKKEKISNDDNNITIADIKEIFIVNNVPMEIFSKFLIKIIEKGI